MASPNVYPNGLAGTGPTVATAKNDYFSGNVYWVSSTSGNNANAGTDRALPKQTLVNALTVAAANDVICLEANHAESIAVGQTINQARLRIIGFGSGSTRPRLTCSGAVDMIAITAAGVKIENVYFPASTAAASSRMYIAANDVEIRDCYFECGALEAGQTVGVGASDGVLFSGCTFAVTAARPSVGLSVLAAAVNDLKLHDLTIDGGSYGWTGNAFACAAAVAGLSVVNLSLLHGSDFAITQTGATYHIFGITADNTSRVVIAA